MKRLRKMIESGKEKGARNGIPRCNWYKALRFKSRRQNGSPCTDLNKVIQQFFQNVRY